MEINKNDPIAVSVLKAIHDGHVDELKQILDQNAGLGTARIVDKKGAKRSLLHIATDWPGHFPNCANTIKTLVEAGADPDAPLVGPHSETPLHWAASSDDVEAIDALLDSGANIESPGAIFTNGTAMSDAVVFAQWNAARRLVERGAKTELWQASALGLQDRVEAYFASEPLPSSDDITVSLWNACRGGQQKTAAYLLERGAELNWIPSWDKVSPLDAARQSGNEELFKWLRDHGAKLAAEIG